jgi:hypothetical protein
MAQWPGPRGTRRVQLLQDVYLGVIVDDVQDLRE